MVVLSYSPLSGMSIILYGEGGGDIDFSTPVVAVNDGYFSECFGNEQDIDLAVFRAQEKSLLQNRFGFVEEAFFLKNDRHFFVSFYGFCLSPGSRIKLRQTDIGSVILRIFTDQFFKLLYFRTCFLAEKEFIVSRQCRTYFLNYFFTLSMYVNSSVLILMTSPLEMKSGTMT